MMKAAGKNANFAIVIETNMVMDKFKKYGNIGSFLLVLVFLVNGALVFLEHYLLYDWSQFFMAKMNGGYSINVLSYSLNVLMNAAGFAFMLYAAITCKKLRLLSRSFLLTACVLSLLTSVSGMCNFITNIQIVTVIISAISILNLVIIICFVVFALTSDMKRQFKVLVAVFGAMYVLESFIPYLLAESTQTVLNFWFSFVKIINFMFYFSLWLGFATYPVDKTDN